MAIIYNQPWHQNHGHTYYPWVCNCYGYCHCRPKVHTCPTCHGAGVVACPYQHRWPMHVETKVTWNVLPNNNAAEAISKLGGN